MTYRFFAFLVIGFLSCDAMSSEAYFVDDKTTHCDLFRSLNGTHVPKDCLVNEKKTPNVKSFFKEPEQPKVTPGRVALDMINFEYASDALNNKAQRILQHVAQVMIDPVSTGLTYRIEGNTDRKGSAHYNLMLSQRRAQAVKRFLIEAGVEPERLSVTGNGFRNLYDPYHPYDAINRRVEIVNTNLENRHD